MDKRKVWSSDFSFCLLTFGEKAEAGQKKRLSVFGSLVWRKQMEKKGNRKKREIFPVFGKKITRDVIGKVRK